MADIWQYRMTGESFTASDWIDVTAKTEFEFKPSHGRCFVKFRIKPKRTDAEIIEKIRSVYGSESVAGDPKLTDWGLASLQSYLRGDF